MGLSLLSVRDYLPLQLTFGAHSLYEQLHFLASLQIVFLNIAYCTLFMGTVMEKLPLIPILQPITSIIFLSLSIIYLSLSIIYLAIICLFVYPSVHLSICLSVLPVYPKVELQSRSFIWEMIPGSTREGVRK